jgi:WD40 repeat protein
MIHRFDLRGGGMIAFCVSPNDGAVATLAVTFRGNVREVETQLVVWNPGTWTERRRITWKDRPQVSQIAFSPGGTTIAMQQHDGALRLCSVDKESTLLRPSPFRGDVESIEFSPNGKLLVTAGQQGVLLWEPRTNRDPEKLSGIPQGAGVVRFSADGKSLAVGCYDGTTRIIDVASRQQMLVIANEDHRHSTEGMYFTPDGAQLIIPSPANSVEFFDVHTAEPARKLESQAIHPLGVAVSSAGDLLACIGSHAAIDVWDVKTGDRISDQWIGHVDPPMQLEFASQDRQLVTSGADGAIRFWDVGTSRIVRTVNHENWVVALIMSPRRDLLLSCGLDDSIRLWDVASGKVKFRLTGHGTTGSSQTTSVAFSADGARCYSFGTDLVLRVNETATGKVLAEHAIRPSGVKIDIGPDGVPTAAVSDIFASGAGGFQFDQAMITATGSHLLIGGRSTSKIYIFDCTSGQETGAFETDGALQGFAVTPDGKTILTMEEGKPAAGDDFNPRNQRTVLRLRDFVSKQARGKVALPGRYSYRMAISSDGALLAFTCSKFDAQNFSRSYRLSVLDLHTLKEVAGKTIEWDSIRQLAFAHSGRVLAAAYADTPVLLWDLDRLRTAQAPAP